MLSSLRVGAIPDSLGPALSDVAWVPVDKLAEILVEVALQQDPATTWHLRRGEPAMFHIINPCPVEWKTLYPVIATELSRAKAQKGGKVIAVSTENWLDRVREDAKKVGEGQKLEEGEMGRYLEVNPALKLLGFYEGMFGGDAEAEEGDKGKGVFEMEKSLERSGKLRGLEGIKEEWVRKWVQEWLAAVGAGDEENPDERKADIRQVAHGGYKI